MSEIANIELVESLAQAIETMAFMSLSPVEPLIQVPSDAVLVWVGYKGPRRGYVELVAPKDLGRLLLGNTLSADPSDTLVMPNPTDPLVELVNITCGLFLKRLKAGSLCEIGVPKSVRFDAGFLWDEFVGEGACDVLSVEGHTIAIRLMPERK